jgi:hypothetical protein
VREAEGSMPLLALFASDSEIVPVGAIEEWCVKRAPTWASCSTSCGRHLGDALHVAAVAGVQEAARDLGADLPAVARHLGPLAQHLAGDRELLVHDRRRALFAGEIERGFPAGDGHLARHVFGEASIDSGEPYFMPSSVIVLPRPRKPMPWRRLRMISSRCCGSGRPLTSTTLSSMRVKTRRPRGTRPSRTRRIR